MNNVFLRQTDIIDPEKLNMPIGIVGAGSVGSWTTLALSKMGCSDISVWDGDEVAEHNAGSQIYKSADSERLKVEVLQEKLSLLTEFPIRIRPYPLTGSLSMPILISAVDSITTRKTLFEGATGWFIDARMAGNALEIYCIDMRKHEDVAFYESTLFAEEETLPIACSARSVVYNVFVCGGLIADLVAKIANGETPPRELLMDFKNLTLFK